MSEQTSAPLSQPTVDTWGMRHQTEAEGVANMMMDLGLTIGIRVGHGERFVFELGDGLKPSALDVAAIAEERFYGDPEFKADMLDYVGNVGNLFVDLPGINAELSTAPAADVVQAVVDAAFEPILVRLRDGELHLVFGHMLAEERDLAAVDLIRLLERRYRQEPEFRAAVQTYLGGEKQTLAFPD